MTCWKHTMAAVEERIHITLVERNKEFEKKLRKMDWKFEKKKHGNFVAIAVSLHQVFQAGITKR